MPISNEHQPPARARIIIRVLQWITSSGMRFSVMSEMRWCSNDPLIVNVKFHDQSIQDWAISRDLIADVALGKVTSAGECDVRVSRSYTVNGPMLALTLSNGTAAIRLRTPMNNVSAFIKETLAIVPLGSEGESMDADMLDNMLVRLINGEYDA